MNPSPTLHSLARILAGLAGAAVAYAIAAYAAMPAALASTTPRSARPSPADSPPLNLPGISGAWNKHPPLPGPAYLHAATTNGLTSAQITLIAAAALLAAAAAAALLARAWAAHRRAAPTHP